jgi:signal transduction histidine kinase
MQQAADADQPPQIELAVDDDGKSGADLIVKAGMGLLGMRERITALGGRLSMETSRPGGLALRAQIPLPPATTRPGETRDAA